MYLLTYLFTYLFIERGREGEREENINVWLPLMYLLLGTWPTDQACALDWEPNWWPFGLPAGTQSTEPHQPGLEKQLHIIHFLWFLSVPT